jgi:hypothetical protein
MAGEPLRGNLRKMLTQKSVIVGGVVTVVVLAVVILGVMAFSPGGNKTPSSTAPPGPTQSQQLTEEADQAAASGDTTTAANLARRAIQLDPNNAKAKALLGLAASQQKAAASKQGNSVSNKSGSNGSSAAGKTSSSSTMTVDFTKKVADIGALLPTTFAGYSMGSPAPSGADVVVAATPLSSSAPAQRVIWAVHDRGSTSSAKQFVTSVSKKTYPVDSASPTVDGAKGYYGTDGTRFATVVYARGRYVFEVLGTATGSDPGTLHDTVIKAAKAFPDSAPK